MFVGNMSFLHTRTRPEMLDDTLWPCEDRCEWTMDQGPISSVEYVGRDKVLLPSLIHATGY